MKKTISVVLAVLICMMAAQGAGPWEVVPKSQVADLDYRNKVGDYFFRFEGDYNSEIGRTQKYLYYSTDGVNYTKTDYLTATLPIYKEGLYFVINNVDASVPESKRSYGFNNSPSYILDKNLNLLSQIDHHSFCQYRGYYKGYHYLSWRDYRDIIYDNGWKGEVKSSTKKTADGIVLEDTEADEDWKIASTGKALYDNTVIYNPFHQDKQEYLAIGEQKIPIEKETEIIRRTFIDTTVPLFRVPYEVGEETVEWAGGRKGIQSITKDKLTMDCIYGVDMPENIGRYAFQVDDYFYFNINDDDSNYYRIAKSALTNHIKVVYQGKLLAFDTPPVVEEGRTLVPMRFLFEQMGAKVDWDGSTQSAMVTGKDEVVSFSIDNTVATVNNQAKTMDVPARLIQDKTMVPVRFLSEELGYSVEWDESNNMVIIEE